MRDLSIFTNSIVHLCIFVKKMILCIAKRAASGRGLHVAFFTVRMLTMIRSEVVLV